MSTQGVILDLDDTLYPELSYADSGFRAVDRFLAAAGACDPGRFHSAAQACFETDHRSRVFDGVMQAMGISLDRFSITELVRVYREHLPTIHLFPDAEAWLAGNRGRYLMGIITDGFALAQRRKVGALKLEARVSCIIYSDDHGREFWKPHVRPYHDIQRRLSLGSEGLVYVGDNPAKDFKGARDAGWRSIRIRRPGTLHQLLEPLPGFEPDLEICSFDHLDAALSRIAGLSTRNGSVPPDAAPAGPLDPAWPTRPVPQAPGNHI
jgi:putative hydrolase of the HAD superfamily